MIMNYPAASFGVSIGSYHNASRGGELNLYPPQEDLSAAGGLDSVRSSAYGGEYWNIGTLE
jgi:hypothetical protein